MALNCVDAFLCVFLTFVFLSFYLFIPFIVPSKIGFAQRGGDCHNATTSHSSQNLTKGVFALTYITLLIMPNVMSTFDVGS